MPDRTAYFADLLARGAPIPCMHPDDFSEKVLSIMRRLEDFLEPEASPPSLNSLVDSDQSSIVVAP